MCDRCSRPQCNHAASVLCLFWSIGCHTGVLGIEILYLFESAVPSMTNKHLYRWRKGALRGVHDSKNRMISMRKSPEEASVSEKCVDTGLCLPWD